jgi:hypothetical protein
MAHSISSDLRGKVRGFATNHVPFSERNIHNTTFMHRKNILEAEL